MIAPECRLAIRAVQSKHAVAVALDLCLLRMLLDKPWTLQRPFHTAKKISYHSYLAANLIAFQLSFSKQRMINVR